MSVQSPSEDDSQCASGPSRAARCRRHCVLMNNGVWMPLVGIAICKGDSAMVEKVVESAVSAGYRLIDTSHAAHNEAAIGNALRRVIAAGKVSREELFIVTKLPCEGNRRDKVHKYLRSSLRKLQLPFVDLFLIHFPDESATLPAVDETDILDTWRGMEEAANMGMTRSIGLCNFNKEQVTRILAMATIKPAALQVECHAYLNQDELLQFCKENSIRLTAYAPLGSPVGSRAVSKPHEYHSHSDLLQDAVIKKIAEIYKKTPAQLDPDPVASTAWYRGLTPGHLPRSHPRKHPACRGLNGLGRGHPGSGKAKGSQ
nr:aldo-keto reductase family 1 member A1-like [Rhipicephalus microplus]